MHIRLHRCLVLACTSLSLLLLGCGGDANPVAASSLDRDGDGLSDAAEQDGWRIWVDETGSGMELAITRTVTSDAAEFDTDHDGLSDREEYELHTDPRLFDTDNDGLGDAEELRRWQTSPIAVDTDRDASGPGGAFPPNTALFDGNEMRLLGTSPSLDDTDGDGRTDFEEFGDPTFRPLIADLPGAALIVDGDIDVRLNVEYAENLGAETQYGTTLTRSQTNTSRSSRSTTHSVGVEVTVGIEHEFGLFGGTTLSGSVTASYDYSTQVTTETETATMLQEESSRYQTDRRELSEVNAGGTITVPIRLANTGESTFTLTDLAISVLHWVPGAEPRTGSFQVMTTLQAARGDYTLAPGARTPILEVSNTNVDAAVIKEFLAHPGSLVLEPALFDLRNASGIDYDFLTERTFKRTALVEIDFGDEVRTWRVATNVARTADGGYAGVAMRDVLGRVLGLPRGDGQRGYVVAEVPRAASGRPFPAGVFALTGIQGREYQAGPQPLRPRAFWAVASTRAEHVDPHLSFEDLVLHGGDQIRLIYCRDEDGDGLYGFEEEFYGNDDADVDGDGDGLTDAAEVKDGWALGNQARRVYSNPRRADTDGDGWRDDAERNAATDPTDPDTDDDGLIDSADPAPLTAATRLFVRQFATGDGSSWTRAAGTLQAALATAALHNLHNGDPADDVAEIWVARGSYDLAPSEAFELQPRLGIYGGFRGDETKLGARDPDPLSNGTVLTGRRAGTQARHVVVAPPAADATAVLDGFTIMEGRADGTGFDGVGAGVLVRGAPTLRRLFCYENHAAVGGGGIHVAPGGGALVLEDCTFNRNTAGVVGGGLDHARAAELLLRRCTFEENSTMALDGTATGGVNVGGGGVRFGGGSSLLRIEGGLFRANQVGRRDGAWARGSAVWLDSGHGLFLGCEFLQNVAWGNQDGFGYGTVTGEYAATLAFADCAMTGNSARLGSAVLGHYVRMVNCTVADNAVAAWRRYLVFPFSWRYVPDGGAVHATGSAELTNTILWGNVCANGSDDPTDCQYRGSMRATYSCIQTLRFYVGIGTVASDPKLEDYRLRADSPCVDAGTNFVDIDPFTPGRTPLPRFDLGGGERVVDGDGRGGAVVDMGAYEQRG